jgi:hypothetical protein
MFTILGADGKEYGPVAADLILQWIGAGRANLQTKARRDGEMEWKNLGDFAEFSATRPAPPPLAPAGAGPAPAAAGAGPGRLQGSAAEIAAILAPQAGQFDLFSCLSRSFQLWSLPLVGATLVSLIVQFCAGLIPILGFFSSLLLTGVFSGGLYYYYLGGIRGEGRQLGDIFAGFTKAFVPLMLATLILNLIILALAVLFFGPLMLVLIKAALVSQHAPMEMPEFSGAALAWMGTGFAVLLYLGLSWIFGYALVIDQGLGPWQALEVSRRVVSRRWFSLFFLMICAGIIGLLGLIGLGIGVIFTLPLAFGTLMYAYDDLCRPR